MTTSTHRVVELVVGFILVGYCAYAIYSGRILGKFRMYTRAENPGSFWTTVIFTFGIGLLFLFGITAWRS